MEATASFSPDPAIKRTHNGAAARTQLAGLVEQYQPRILRLGVLLSYVGVSILLYLGWMQRGEQFLTAESGLGYALGIIGGSMMLLLLMYPLRKKARFMRNAGPVKFWFRMHMTFGVVGPVGILYHCDFQLGSLNSNVALFCMITVASSGLIGRYLYMRIHKGLYGSKANLDELRRDAQTLKDELAGRVAFAPSLLERLDTFEKQTLCEGADLLTRVVRKLTLGFRLWRTRLTLRRLIREEISSQAENLSTQELRTLRRSLNLHVNARLESVRQVAGFRFYETIIFCLAHPPLPAVSHVGIVGDCACVRRTYVLT